ncbi:hypothetical protein PsYK624_138450 [Phanerochaete sordida]|uniref:Uncharacterized protein n=1 Tax=Phanerochaete sordida TaxID=48140 RepID=A0A9P3GQJ0_9APHY|nr:hypothetical protein PsYK624_138450 [Phanerochaete sordida]
MILIIPCNASGLTHRPPPPHHTRKVHDVHCTRRGAASCLAALGAASSPLAHSRPALHRPSSFEQMWSAQVASRETSGTTAGMYPLALMVPAFTTAEIHLRHDSKSLPVCQQVRWGNVGLPTLVFKTTHQQGVDLSVLDGDSEQP